MPGRTTSGMTLVEVAVVLALTGLIGGTIGITLLRQQRFYRGATERLAVNQGIRDAMEVLSTDIRGMSASDTVRLLADSAIEFFANIGSSILCQNLNGTDIGLPAAFASGNTLTAFLSAPDSGDLALFYSDSVASEGHWERHAIRRFTSRSLDTSCSPASGFTGVTDADAGGTGFLLELSTPLSARVKTGAPVRFVRRGRYSLYRAPDRNWYLGYRRCAALGTSACEAIQPVSGPYRNYSKDPRVTGLLFEYFDAEGAQLHAGSAALSLARVDITARAESRQRILVEGQARPIGDSATVSIALRNKAS